MAVSLFAQLCRAGYISIVDSRLNGSVSEKRSFSKPLLPGGMMKRNRPAIPHSGEFPECRWT